MMPKTMIHGWFPTTVAMIRLDACARYDTD